MKQTNLILRWKEHPGLNQIETYRSLGGFAALRKALAMKPGDVIDEVKKATLRGRGGAGFPAGQKWSFLAKVEGPRYLVINADEGEPGTFKDRYIMAEDPFRLIEGAVIAGWACGLTDCYIYLRGEFADVAKGLRQAIAKARAAGILGPRVLGTDFSFDIYVHLGAGAYICGEETALLESLEGKPGRPRLKPPYPAVVGAFGRPSIINNVETIASVPIIVEMGGEAFHKLGVEGDGGVKLFGLSGHVKNPGLYEFPMGKNLKEFIEQEGGGTLNGGPIKGVIPGGSSTPILRADELDIPLTFDGVRKAGSMLGTACITVIEEPTCAVALAYRVASFYAHESCGQCTPCREGCAWIAETLRNLELGHGRPEDVDLLLSICDNIEGHTICALGDACAMPVRALVKKFRPEFDAHARQQGCAHPDVSH